MKLIKTELYKLRTTKMFYILNAVIFAVNIAVYAFAPMLMKLMSPNAAVPAVNLSEAIANPFSIGLLMMMVLISAVSFLYLDFGHGYIKNIAGQMKNRGRMVLAKYAVIGVHNLLFFVIAALGTVIGCAISGQLVIDDAIGGGIATLMLKWLLSMALCALLMLIVVGMRSKSFAIIMAVIFGAQVLSLLYMGLNAAITNVFQIGGVAIQNYMPDTLIGTVNALDGTLIWNAVIVSVIWIAVFTALSYTVFRKRDIQ